MEGIKENVQKEINETPVIVYSKTWCPYCDEAKEILKSADIDIKAVELDNMSNGD